MIMLKLCPSDIYNPVSRLRSPLGHPMDTRMNTRLTQIYSVYEDLLIDVENEFDRVRNMFLDRMQCRKGCSSCCHQLFAISTVEAAYISKAVNELAPEERDRMRQRARQYLKELLGSDFLDDQNPEDSNLEAPDLEDHSRAVREALRKQAGLNHIPCPALVDDACAIYDHRPVMARKFGIPLWNPNKPNELQACELNFKPGEVIEGENLVEPQIVLEYRWLEFKQGLQDELSLPELVATVASAVVFNYQALLEERIAGNGPGYWEPV